MSKFLLFLVKYFNYNLSSNYYKLPYLAILGMYTKIYLFENPKPFCE